MINIYDFTGLDLDFNFATEPKHVATLKVTNQTDTLFFSISYRIIAIIDGNEYACSKPSHVKQTNEYTMMWARQLLRANKDELTRMSVDVEREYENFGGKPEDLYKF